MAAASKAKGFTLADVKELLGVESNKETAKVFVTPKQAERLLKGTNSSNRSINYQTVEAYKRDMERGNWHDDVDYIGFNPLGELVNGQHRLRALSKANLTKLQLKFDFNVEQHMGMDTGRNRTYADQAQIFEKMGHEVLPTKFKTVITSGLRLSHPNVKLSNDEIREIGDAFRKEIYEADELGLFDLGSKTSAATVKSSFLWAYLSGVDTDVLKHVAEVIRTGMATKGELDMPIIKLRDALMDLGGSGSEIAKRRAQWTQNTIWKVLNGITNKVLKVSDPMHYQGYPFLEEARKRVDEMKQRELRSKVVPFEPEVERAPEDLEEHIAEIREQQEKGLVSNWD